MPSHTLKWAQDRDHEVGSWEFQYSPNGVVWRWVESASVVDPCDNCYQVGIDIPEDVMMVRSRAITDSQSSGWSEPHYLPELSSVDIGWSNLLFGFVILLCLAQWRMKDTF
jgi:hypothetical protein